MLWFSGSYPDNLKNKQTYPSCELLQVEFCFILFCFNQKWILSYINYLFSNCRDDHMVTLLYFVNVMNYMSRLSGFEHLCFSVIILLIHGESFLSYTWIFIQNTLYRSFTYIFITNIDIKICLCIWFSLLNYGMPRHKEWL